MIHDPFTIVNCKSPPYRSLRNVSQLDHVEKFVQGLVGVALRVELLERIGVNDLQRRNETKNEKTLKMQTGEGSDLLYYEALLLLNKT